MSTAGPFIKLRFPADTSEKILEKVAGTLPSGDELNLKLSSELGESKLEFRGMIFSIYTDIEDGALLELSANFYGREAGDDPKWCQDFSLLCRVLYDRLKPILLRTGYEGGMEMFENPEQNLETIQWIDWINIWAPAWEKIYPAKIIMGVKGAFKVAKMSDGGWYIQATELAFQPNEREIRESLVKQLGIELPFYMQ